MVDTKFIFIHVQDFTDEETMKFIRMIDEVLKTQNLPFQVIITNKKFDVLTKEELKPLYSAMSKVFEKKE